MQIRKFFAIFNRWIESHPLLSIAILMPLFVLCVFAAIKLLTTVEGYRPRFDLVLDLEAPQTAGTIEVYLNGDFYNPRRLMIQPPGNSIYVFPNVPKSITHIRIDPAYRSDIDIKINAIRFVTGKNFRAAPGVEVFKFDTSDWKGWSFSNMERHPGTSRFRTTTSDPVLYAYPKIDLRSLISKSTRIPLIIYYLAAFIALVGVVLFVTSIKVVSAIGARWSKFTYYAVPTTLAVLGWILTILSSFPGHTNFDEFYSLNEVFAGNISDIHPPLQAVVWAALIGFTKAIGFGETAQVASMLLVQSTLFWLAAGVLAFAFRSRALGVLFLLILALAPPVLSYLGHIGKDTQLGIALFIAVTLFYLALRHRSYSCLVIALLPIFYGLSVRSNGPAAALPLCFLWVVIFLKLRDIELKTMVQKSALILASLVLFAGLIGANKTFYDAVVVNKCCLGNAGFMTPVHDLMGMSARIEKNLVPPYMYSDPSYSLETIKKNYYPQNVDWGGLKRIAPEDHRNILLDWLAAIRTYPLAYLGHRWAVFQNFIGFTDQPNSLPLFLGFFKSAGIDRSYTTERSKNLVRNIDELETDLYEIKSAFVMYFIVFKNSLLFRPWFYIVLAITSFLYLGGRGEQILSRFSWYVGMSGALYFLPYILLTSSASFRYVWWSLLATILLILFRLDETLQAPPEPRQPGRDRPLPYRWAQSAILARLIAPDGYFRMARIHPDLVLFAGVTVLCVLLGYVGIWALS